MASSDTLETEALWGRLGLQELYSGLVRFHVLTKRFEESLRALPTCTACARVKLLEEVQATGERLSGEVATLTLLAESLRAAVSLIEHAQTKLKEEAPEPCRCPAGPCRCHR